MRIALAALCVLSLVACASTDKVGQAVTTPLSDLNLVQAPIPPLLAEARKAPYRLPDDISCTGLKSQVVALDEVLGPDIDAPSSPNNPGLIERGVDEAATGVLQHTVEGVVPFRGWVRKLTGAERYSKQVAAAIAAGGARRAFFKGLATGRGCY